MAGGAATAILADSNGAAIAALSVASLVVGYGLLAGLWYFVFSPGAERRAERRNRAAQETPPLPPEAGEAGLPARVAAPREDDPTRLRRRIPARRR
jgi:hypothetical protein